MGLIVSAVSPAYWRKATENQALTKGKALTVGKWIQKENATPVRGRSAITVLLELDFQGSRPRPLKDSGGVTRLLSLQDAVVRMSRTLAWSPERIVCHKIELIEWNGPFDPAEFDVTQATRRFKRGLPAW